MRRSTTLATLAAAATLLATPRAVRAADACIPSRALVVLDKSSSMVTGTVGGARKWDVAVDALDQVVTTYQSSIELGLMMFPAAGECSTGTLDVTPALGMRDEIVTALGAPPPETGNWTPMAQTLHAAAGEASLLDASRPRHVILITDGWQWCSPYDPSTRFTPVDAVAALAALGVRTYVVGFGDGVDALALNRMAVEGGTALAGCDAAGDSPTAANPCYLRADEPGELLATLESIALELSGEVCDGIDNDCDGTVDNGCECLPGESRACGTSEGACQLGVQTCSPAGAWGSCEGQIAPVAESCDGVDDDCDGEVDDEAEGALCAAGLTCLEGRCVLVAEPPSPPVVHAPEDHDTEEPAPLPAEELPGGPAGCGCRAAGGGGAPVGALLAGVLLAILAASRRRPRA